MPSILRKIPCSLYVAESELAQSQATMATNLVGLNRALGDG
jgi:hypothetical protein